MRHLSLLAPLFLLAPLIISCAAKKSSEILYPITTRPCIDGLYAFMKHEGCIETYQADLPNSPITKFRCTTSKGNHGINESVFYAVPPHVGIDDDSLRLICSDLTGNVYMQIDDQSNKSN
jgi:hypothetical protein